MSTHPKPKPTPHDRQFKPQAVQLLNTRGRPLAQVARELGRPPWQWRDWKNRLQPQLAQPPENREALRLAKRQRANLHLRQQRDLQKTLGIASTT